MHRPGRSPSQRFRFEQYLEYLNSKGYACTHSHLLSAEDDPVFYESGRMLSKLKLLLKALATRARDIARAPGFDAILIQREAFFLGTIAIERLVRRGRTPLVFDLDDSIWLPNVSAPNQAWAWLKRPQKTNRLVAMADLVLAGNRFLADHSRKFNDSVEVFPTTIDTTLYQRKEPDRSNSVCVGWTGSTTTIEHFQIVVPVLRQIRDRFGQAVSFRVIGDSSFEVPELGLRGEPWRAETEVADISAFDIGIMPLPDTDWERGKCGLKALQYMALEVPAVVSPVGVNTEIVESGVNGLVARTTADWVKAIGSLIASPELRQRLGKAGRETVVESYSFDSQKERYLGFFDALCGSPR